MRNKKTHTDNQKSELPASKNLAGHFKWHAWVIFGFGVLVYLNTLFHQFTQDDAIVIYDNMYTTQGLSGWKGIFTKDTFFGFFKEEGKAKLVSGGRYRPMTLAMFALEYEIAGKNPFLGHLINILLYGFLCFMVYKLLILLLCYKEKSEPRLYLVFAAAFLYACHPIHTEAVANIKGRDEIMSMLGSVVALYAIIKYYDLKQMKYLIIGCISFFIGLMSKENAITFLAILPLTLYYFRSYSLLDTIKPSMILFIPAVLFLIIRSAILGNDFGGTPMELMNNPYLKMVNGSYIPFSSGEKMATIIYTLGKYIWLLIFPHPLTHDYYPRHIGIMSFGDWKVLLSLFIYVGLIFVAFKGFAKRSLVSFGILYFIITLSIVSNVVFPIGTNMSERFMFMPSLGFALVMAYLLKTFVYDKFGKQAFIITLGIILGLYSLKTITRNFVWKSDFKLFTTDVKTSTQSAKVLNAAGGALTTEAFKEENEEKKKEMLTQALVYLNQAVAVHPTYKNAYLIMGNAHYYLKEFEPAVRAYENALAIDSEFEDARKNMAVSLRDGGRIAGEVEQNFEKCEKMLFRSYELFPDDIETVRLLGVVNGMRGKHQEAIKYFEKVVLLEPNNANGFMNLGNAYKNSGDIIKGELNIQKALELDPKLQSQ